MRSLGDVISRVQGVWDRIFGLSKYIDLTAFVALLFIAVPALWIIFTGNFRESLVYIRNHIAGSRSISWGLFGIGVLVGIIHYIADTPGSGDNEYIFVRISNVGGELGEAVTIIGNGLTYGYVMKASFLFLGKSFVQIFFEKTFIVGFSKQDLILLAIVVSYVLYDTIKKVTFMGIQALFTREVGEVIMD